MPSQAARARIDALFIMDGNSNGAPRTGPVHGNLSKRKAAVKVPLSFDDEDDGMGPTITPAQHRLPKRKPTSMKPSPSLNGDNSPNDLDRDNPLKRKRVAKQLDGHTLEYIPKAERERMAREAKEKEETARKEADEKRNQEARAWMAAALAPAPPPTMPPPRGPRADRGRGHGRRDEGRDKKPVEPKKEKEWDEWAETRRRYMGPDLSVSKFTAKKAKKRNDKFTFEWSAEDDTTSVNDPTYKGADYKPYVGTRVLAGYDESFEEEAMEKRAQLIRQSDKETGEARARELMRAFHAGRAKKAEKQVDVHWSLKSLQNMRERDWRIFKEDYDIRTQGGGLPNPLRSWRESSLPPQILDIIDHLGYGTPSPVQRAAVPIALQKRDLIGVAVTGSGKTAAFLLPLLVYIMDLPRLDKQTFQDGPYAIILAPTRELAQQIETETNKFARPLGFRSVSIVGGHSIEEQAFSIANGVEIIIATPGRLLDHLDRQTLILAQCCYVIMDEADRMIDMGFEDSVKQILSALPVTNMKPDDERAENAQAMSTPLGGVERYRQTMLYTATLPAGIERIAKQYLRRPAQVTIGTAGAAVDTVEQRTEFISGDEKRKRRMQELVQSPEVSQRISRNSRGTPLNPETSSPNPSSCSSTSRATAMLWPVRCANPAPRPSPCTVRRLKISVRLHSMLFGTARRAYLWPRTWRVVVLTCLMFL